MPVPYMCYHAELGHTVSNGEGKVGRVLKKIGSVGSNPWDGGMADYPNRASFPRVTKPNLVILGQTVCAEISQKSRAPHAASHGHQN